MTPAQIAAYALAAEQLARLAADIAARLRQGGMTEPEFQAAWTEMQARLARANAAWEGAARIPPAPLPEQTP